jgi:hypothetical protein
MPGAAAAATGAIDVSAISKRGRPMPYGTRGILWTGWWIVLALSASACPRDGKAAEGPGADALVAAVRANLERRGIEVADDGRSPAEREIRKTPTAVPVEQYRRLVRTGTWTEVRPDAAGRDQTVSVTAEIWTAAIQAALDEHRAVRIARRAEPYYLDGPLVLKSGRRLLADPAAEIRLKPSTDTCMVRNEHLLDGEDGPVGLGPQADRDILVAGGIWTTLAHAPKQLNGNLRGVPGGGMTVRGAFGVMLFNQVDGLQVKGLTIKEGRPFGIQMSVCRNFLIERITFVNHRCDGVHVNGPASDGILREIGGVTFDDMVALNAWDWRGSAMTFGPIERLWLQGIHGTLRPRPGPTAPWPPSDGTSQIRLLAGTKRYPDGRKLDCDIRDCVFDGLDGLRTVKMYDQPNLGCRDQDFADPIGRMINLHFRGIDVFRYIGKPLFEIGSNVDGMRVQNVSLYFDLRQPPFDAYKLIEIGPQSDTYRPDPNDRRTWTEIYSPDKDCTVRRLGLSGLRYHTADGGQKRDVPGESLVRVIAQKPNPDYPKTTPKGGTGRGIWIKDECASGGP